VPGRQERQDVDEVRRRVLEQVDENWEREVGFLRGLVQRPSTVGN
jgi:hypothetical protein